MLNKRTQIGPLFEVQMISLIHVLICLLISYSNLFPFAFLLKNYIPTLDSSHCWLRDEIGLMDLGQVARTLYIICCFSTDLCMDYYMAYWLYFDVGRVWF